MLNIYLCDDESSQLENLSKTIEEVIEKNHYNMSVVLSTTSPFPVLNNIKISNSKINMYFLDVDLNTTMNGIELAHKIRTFDPRAFIVIVSAYEEYMPLTFSYMIEPLAYILKGNQLDISEQISHCLKLAKDRYETTINKKISTDYLTLHTKTRTIEIDPKDLYYITISSIPHTLEICSKRKLTQVRGSINDTIQKLPGNFIKISRETIINTNYIKEFDNKMRTLTLINESLFHVSVRKCKDIKKTCKTLN